MEKINIAYNKTLRLDNVLVKDIINLSNILESGESDEIPIEVELERMETEIKTKGANQIGPLIQYSFASGNENSVNMRISLMLQADKYINNVSYPYYMESVISVNNCMYTRFCGTEEDIQYAYQKIAVTAYEENIKLKGSSYTVFLDSDDSGNITADIFMERADA
ncbi:MAG: hypothetical protein J6D57_08125 [Mogibacterium sp.]|nr:hypothetical protein [Mogibacterium sp.]